MEVCEDGYLRDSEGYIGVAMGGSFGDIGTRYTIYLDTDIEINVIKIEEKADIHTCEHNMCHEFGDIIEFVVDSEKMDYAYISNGHPYDGNFNNAEEFKGVPIRIEKQVEMEMLFEHEQI